MSLLDHDARVEQARVAGTCFSDGLMLPEMVVIPPGSFLMGADNGTAQRSRAIGLRLSTGWRSPDTQSHSSSGTRTLRAIRQSINQTTRAGAAEDSRFAT